MIVRSRMLLGKPCYALHEYLLDERWIASEQCSILVSIGKTEKCQRVQTEKEQLEESVASLKSVHIVEKLTEIVMLLMLQDFRQRMQGILLHDYRYGYNWHSNTKFVELMK